MKPATIDPPEIHETLWDGIAGQTGWDIGANCGQTLTQMVSRFPTVHVFEPAAECLPWLNPWATRENHGRTVRIWPIAVSDFAGQITLLELPDKIDTGQLVTDIRGMEWNPQQPGATERTVPARTVDSLADEIGPPDFMKIDVEGHEMRVLAGAYQTLKDFQPELLIEFHSPQLHTRIIECLHHHDYTDIDTIRHPHYPPKGRMWHQHGWVRASAE